MSSLYFFIVSQVGLFALGFLIAKMVGTDLRKLARTAVEESGEWLEQRVKPQPIPATLESTEPARTAPARDPEIVEVPER